MHPPKVEFVSPGPVEFLQSSPVGLQGPMLRGLLPMPDLQLREPDLGLGTFTFVGEPLRYDYFPVSRSPTYWVRFVLKRHPSCLLVVVASLSLEVEYLSW